MDFKKRDEPIYTSDFWYDLTDGGYIDPDELLHVKDARRVNEAVQVIREFEEAAIAKGVIEIS